MLCIVDELSAPQPYGGRPLREEEETNGKLPDIES